MTEITWRKSSYSGQNGDCVEVAEHRDAVLVRNSNSPDRGTLVLSPASMASFVAASRSGELDDLG